jgi:acyl-CoA synthetase (AMP-forming)/AMP-acid ligase II
VSSRSGVAVIDRTGRELTFAELDRRVAAVRAGLLHAGLTPGDHVFFAVRPGTDSLTLGLAVLGSGATVIVADPGAGDELFAARAALVQQRGGQCWAAAESVLYALLACRPIKDLIRRRGLLLPDFGRLEGARHVRTGRWLPGTPRGALSLDELALTVPADASDDSHPAPDSPALIVFTSGTTAAPRAVVHTLATLDASRDLFNTRIGWGPGDVVLTDQLMVALPAMAAGATWALPGPGAARATHYFGTPAAIAKLPNTGSLPASLRCIVLGAAPVPPALLRRVRKAAASAEILSVYGTTEALPIAVVDAEAKLAHAADGDLLGAPLPGVSVRIGDDRQFLVRGPHLAGYLDGPAVELATGDLGRLDAQGRLVLLGRAKDMLIRGSFNLYPGLYEPAVASRPGVVDCAFVGVPDPVTADEQVVLAVVPEAGQSPARLVRRLAAELPRYIDAAACPDRIVPVAAIPRRGRTAKPDRDALRKLVGAP